MESKSKGFTLIELMISITIIGLLVAIAYPSFVRYVQDGWRITAQLCLLEIAQSMEQRYSTEFTFRLVDGSDTDKVDVLLEGGCATEGGMPARYRFSFNPALNVSGAASFAVQAVPLNGQVGDSCGQLSVDSQGVKGTVKAGCWQ